MLDIFFRLCKAELLKTKKLSIVVFHITIALISISALFFFFYNQTYEEFQNNNRLEIKPNPWFIFYRSYLFLFVIFLPLIASVTTYIIKSIEDRADAWKRLFVLPYNKLLIHLAKLCVIIFYLTLYLLLTVMLLLISSTLLSGLKPDFQFSHFNNYRSTLIVFFIKFEIAIIAITAFTYAYLIIIKKTIITLLMSIFLALIGLTITSHYSASLDQFNIYIRKRQHLLLNNIPGYDDLSIKLFASQDIFCLVIVFISLIAIYIKSKKPIINFE